MTALNRLRRRRGRIRAAALLAVVAALAIAAAPAGAYYGEGAQIVSADFDRLEQGDAATVFAAISANGRYVAIQTRARNFFADDDPDPPGQYRAGGVFRFDLETQALEKVADGDLFEEAGNGFLRRGASNPSISANGRYVAFVTAEQLLPTDENDHVDVYVRDMQAPIGGSGAYDLVSARDGGDLPAQYGPPTFPFPGSEPGSDLSRGVAISADGQRVVFRTDAPTDLPASGSVDVPAGQVFLRDRAADTTTLVTAERDPETETMTAQPAGGAYGAALSADGSTVAWTGANAAAQTRFLGGENEDSSFAYYLWRRVGAEPAAPTRRITGLADPDDPACPPEQVSFFNRTNTGPCYGPLADQEGLLANITAMVPALSADGYTVAFLSGSGPRPLSSTGPGHDLYLTEMTPGLSRKEATVELTRDTIGTDPATSPALGSVAISADGSHLAITTSRTRFVLPALQLLGEPRAVPGPRELYVVDLAARTVERATSTYWGGDIEADVLNGTTLSADGSRVAFVSFAGTLFYGDANQTSDAFVVERQPEPGEGAPPEREGEGEPDGTIETEAGGPRIGVQARSKRGGAVVLTVSVPAAGGVRAVARGRAGRPRRKRVLAVAKGRAKGTKRTKLRLVLRPVARYRPELRRTGRLSARVRVSFVAARGGRRVAASARIAFRQRLSRHSKKRP